MIRNENASELLNNSKGDFGVRMCLLRQKKNAAAESVFYALILLNPCIVEVNRFCVWLHWLFCVECGNFLYF